MKKLLALVLLPLLASSSHAAITPGNPDYEPFADASGRGGTTYAVGANLIGQQNSQGLTWVGAGSNNAFQPVITNGNLSVPGLLSSTGNSVVYGPANSGDNGDTGRLGLGGAISNGTVYYSMAMKLVALGSLPSGGAVIAGFNNSTGTQTGQPSVIDTKLYLRTNGAGGYNIGLEKGGSSPVWDPGNYNVGDTVFIVGGYTFNNGASFDDVSSLWINPASSSFGAATAPTPNLTDSTGSDIASSQVASFLLRQASHLEPSVVADDVRVGITWADVTPPQKMTPTFSNLTASQSTPYGASNLTLSGTISATGPVYPTNGETVAVIINGHPQNATVTDSTGDFSVNYNASAIPATDTPYTITYSYAGDTFLSSATNTSTTLTVTPLPVTLSGARYYDGTSTAAANILTVANVVGSDDVTVASGSATLAGASAGAKSIASVGSLALGGITASNYTLIGASGSVTINPLPLVLTGTRAYNGSSTAAFSILSISNKVGSDDVSLASGSADLAGPGPGSEPILDGGTLTLSGSTASDYTLTGVSGSVAITGGTIVVQLAGTRPYNGLTSASYTILTIANKNPGDDVFLASGAATLAGATATSQAVTSPNTLTLGGANASAYTLSGATGSVTITPLPVVLSGTRLYDGTNDASSTNLTVANKVGSDDVTVASGSATLAGSSAGSESISSMGTLTLGGTTAPNYTVVGGSGSVTIAPLVVTLSGKRQYDGTATASSSVLVVANKIGADDVTVASGSATLAGAALGSETITSLGTLTLGGTTAPDYTLTGASGSVFILFAPGHPVFDPFADASASGGTSYSGGNLIGQTNAQGLTWYSAGATNNPPSPTISGGSLSVSGLAASTGNSVSYGNAAGDTARLGLGTNVTSGTLYYSMILQVTSLGSLTTNGGIIAGFNNSTGSQGTQPTVIGTRLEVRLDGSGFDIGLDKSGTGLVWDGTTRNVGDTIFVVGSYTFNTTSTNDDTTSLWINPSSASFGAGSAPTPSLTSATGGDISAGQIASFLLREASTVEPPMLADEVRVGYSWADVTPSTATTSAPFRITGTALDNTKANIIISWQSTPGANYHIVGSPNVGAPLNTWTNVGSPISAIGTNTSATNPVGGPVNFYEVISP